MDKSSEQISVERPSLRQFGMTDVVITRDASLSVNARFVYTLLTGYAAREGRALYVSRQTLADFLGKSVDTVDRALKELSDARIVVIEHTKTDEGDYGCNRYILNDLFEPGVAAPMRGGSRTHAARGSRTHAALTESISLTDNLEPSPTVKRADSLDSSAELQKPKPAPTEQELRPDVEQVCNHLADRIEGNGCKRPVVTDKWRKAARSMLDKENKTSQQIINAINWCQDSDFWCGNIMSMVKLRRQWDVLRLQAARENKPRHANGLIGGLYAQ